jgi:hypothetical protein
MRTHVLRLAMCSAVVGLLAALSGSADAQGKKKGGGVVGEPYAPILQELQKTRMVVNQADRDYKGFRAKAVHEVGKAMHALQANHKHKLPPAPKLTGTEPQNVSDGQLVQGAKQIQAVIVQLNNLPGNKNTAAAVGHLQTAIGHLNTALKIK